MHRTADPRAPQPLREAQPADAPTRDQDVHDASARTTWAAYLGTTRTPADVALREAGLRPLELDGRDALGLVNGTSLTAAAAGLAAASVTRSLVAAQPLSAVMADLLRRGPRGPTRRRGRVPRLTLSWAGHDRGGYRRASATRQEDPRAVDRP